MNILPLVMQYFGPVIMNKIAGSLGINSTLAQRAIAAAAPAILAGIIGKTMQPGGAKVLADVIAGQDPGVLGKLGEMIGTGRQAAVVEQGSSALGGLLGNSTLGALAGALSKQVGLGAGASNTLLGLMAPAILGTLAKEQKSAGLDAAGLANDLAAQKTQIVDAIPPDFAKLLQGTGLLDGVTGKSADRPTATVTAPRPITTPAAAAAVSRPAATGSAAKPATPAATPHHHHFSWGPWLLAIAAACALWWAVFGDKAMQTQQSVMIPADVPPSTTLASNPMPDVAARTDVGKTVLSLMDETRGAVSGVRDAATAQTALPRLQDVAGKLEKAGALAAQMNPDAHRALATWVASQSSAIKAAIAGVVALPGVGPVLKPTLDQISARIDALGKV